MQESCVNQETKIKGKWPKEQASIIHINEEHYKYILKTKVQEKIIYTYKHSKLTRQIHFKFMKKEFSLDDDIGRIVELQDHILSHKFKYNFNYNYVYTPKYVYIHMPYTHIHMYINHMQIQMHD